MNYNGMWVDGDPAINPENTSRKNKNVIERNNVIISESGFTPKWDVPFKNLCGRIPISNGDFVLFGVNYTPEGAKSQILVGNDDGYKIIVDIENYTGVLGFDIAYPITGHFVTNYLNERIVIFADGHSFIGRVNVDNPPTEFNQFTFRFFPVFQPPVVTASSLTGGSLLAGGYIPFYQMEGLDGETSRFYLLNPVNLGAGNNGVKEGALSSSQITYIARNVTSVKIAFGFVRKVNGVISAWKTEAMYSTPTTTFSITSEEGLQQVTTDELLVQTAVFSAKEIAIHQDELLAANVIETKRLPLQWYAEGITLDWVSKLVLISQRDQRGYSPDVDSNTKDVRSFPHGEVIAFYIRRIYVEGVGDWNHIPGRIPMPTDFDLVEVGKDANGETIRRKNFQANSTAYQTFTDKFKGIRGGQMGYWENEDEVYEQGTTFAGQKVRHHRMPSFNIMRNLYGNGDYLVKYVDRLGVRVNFGRPFPEEAGVLGWELGFAQRTFGNSTVAGQAPLVHSFFISEAGNGYNKYYLTSSGFNFNSYVTPRSSTLANKSIDNASFEVFGMAAGRYRLLSPEILKDNLYIPEMYLKLSAIFQNDGFTDINSGESESTFRNTASYLEPLSSLPTPENNHHVLDQRIIANNSTQALDNGLGSTLTIDNLLLEKHLYARVSNPVDVVLPSSTGIINNTKDVTILVSIMMHKTNTYFGYKGQKVVKAGANTDDNIIYGGDVIQAYTSMNSYGRWEYIGDIRNKSEDKDVAVQFTEGARITRAFFIESPMDLNRRVLDLNDPTTYTLRTFSLGRDKDPNNLEASINDDYTFINNLEDSTIFNPNKPFLSRFPFRIYRGPKQVRESAKFNWYQFKTNNYYEMPKDRGEIIAIVPRDNYILIVTRYAVYRTQSNAQLQTTSGVSVGTGKTDIFEQDPIELMHSEFGSIGARSRDCVKNTKFGVVIVDQDARRIYLIDQGITEISSAGHELFFFDNIETTINNTYLGFGFEIVEDRLNKRILFTRKQKDNPNFKGAYVEGMKLEDGDIVFKDGKYQEYFTTNESIPGQIL